MHMLRWVRQFSSQAISRPRIFPSSGFTLLEASKTVEEEAFPWYNPSTYYPVRLGQVFQSRYQALAKLGFGTSATVWLGRDLMEHRYVALKVCIRDYPSIPREKAAFERLRSIKDSPVIQKCWDNFRIEGVEGAVHECFVLQPLTINLGVLGEALKKDVILFRLTTRKIMDSLRFLHEEAKLIHCDLGPGNFLLGVAGDHVFEDIEAAENRDPSPRKIDGERVIHTTPHEIIPETLSDTPTGVVLSDFGEARPGDVSTPCYDDIQPFPYRSPEVILEVPFSYPTDIWNAGVMLWHMAHSEGLFDPGPEDSPDCNVIHLGQMVAVMGAPPPALLKRCKEPEFIHKHYFNAEGRWIGRIPVPSNMSLESKESRLNDEDKAEFLRFIRRCLQWEPEKRATAAELCEDPWLNPSE
ncbi:putative CDK4/6 [Heliocybe sulcata]|uniref:non-specific serine/threonine protein kinase n=1 Tax=Heliocybe sulcata TaxID=5364 RepID=A0A5C3MQL0_9AGAM|nr:putative CDK4/6 [Heliocybe sulcata]